MSGGPARSPRASGYPNSLSRCLREAAAQRRGYSSNMRGRFWSGARDRAGGRPDDHEPSGRRAPDGVVATGRRRFDLLDPRELAQVRDLELVARGVVEGFLIGLHRSPERGLSAEFAENRLYNPGDDVRFVDWKVYARTDRVYIKQFEEETNLQAHLLVDASRSMGWSSEPGVLPSKLAYARLLAASVALLLLGQGDAPGLAVFDATVRAELPPRATRAGWWRLVRTLEAAEAEGKTRAESALRELASRARRRGLVILISDLLVDTGSTRAALHYLRHAGHELLVFHLIDPGECELPAAGEAIFFDPETGEEVRGNSASLRREYGEAMGRSLAAWRRDCLEMGAEYARIVTDAPLGFALRRFLERRPRGRVSGR